MNSVESMIYDDLPQMTSRITEEELYYREWVLDQRLIRSQIKNTAEANFELRKSQLSLV